MLSNHLRSRKIKTSPLISLVSAFFPLQYDYMERLDGKEKWSVVESPRERRSIQTVVLNEAVFVQYLDPGTWHLAFYNDGKEKESVSFSTAVLGQLSCTFTSNYITQL